MSLPWFFVPRLPAPGEDWWLPRDEARHALGARRLEAGEDIVLFDGCGGFADARLTDARLRDGSTRVQIEGHRTATRSGRAIHLMTALPKGDRLATLVDMTAQLGIASLTPLRCQRSVVGETANRTERIRRIQIEACKQAHVAWLPELREERTPGELPFSAERHCLVAHPGGSALRGLELAPDEPCTIAIGPEGGFTDAELATLLAAGARSVDLGPTLLRIETAAVVATALLRAL